MAIALTTSHQQQLDVLLIDTTDNVRELDHEHVTALATSINLQGLLVPLVVRSTGGGRYELVAGFTGSRRSNNSAPTGWTPSWSWCATPNTRM